MTCGRYLAFLKVVLMVLAEIPAAFASALKFFNQEEKSCESNAFALKLAINKQMEIIIFYIFINFAKCAHNRLGN